MCVHTVTMSLFCKHLHETQPGSSGFHGAAWVETPVVSSAKPRRKIYARSGKTPQSLKSSPVIVFCGQLWWFRKPGLSSVLCGWKLSVLFRIHTPGKGTPGQNRISSGRPKRKKYPYSERQGDKTSLVMLWLCFTDQSLFLVPVFPLLVSAPSWGKVISQLFPLFQLLTFTICSVPRRVGG